jgi:hypothetical protein
MLAVLIRFLRLTVSEQSDYSKKVCVAHSFS